MLDKNWIRDFFKSIDYPIGTLSELYEDNQSTIKIVLVEKITTQSRALVPQGDTQDFIAKTGRIAG